MYLRYNFIDLIFFISKRIINKYRSLQGWLNSYTIIKKRDKIVPHTLTYSKFSKKKLSVISHLKTNQRNVHLPIIRKNQQITSNQSSNFFFYHHKHLCMINSLILKDASISMFSYFTYNCDSHDLYDITSFNI